MCPRQSVGIDDSWIESSVELRSVCCRCPSDSAPASELDLRHLPYDVHYNITETFTIEEFFNFCLVGGPLLLLLDDLFLCGRLVDNWILYSKEVKLARQINAPAPKIIKRIHRRRSNIARATPVSVSIVGYGSKFVYSDGLLCFLDSSNLLRLLDVHGSAKSESVFDIHAIVTDVLPKDVGFQRYSISPLSCSKSLIILLCELASVPKFAWLVVIKLNSAKDGLAEPPLIEEIPYTNRLFVRHSEDYVLCGTHTALRSDGHHEWVMRITSLNDASRCRDNTPGSTDSKTCDPLPLHIRGFAGSDIGINVAFEIHEGWLYGVANQTTFDLEEVDWTSFYHGFRCQLNDPVNTFEESKDIYRRQHNEGPINDGWTRLQIQVDERTNQLLIIESRREWLKGGSKQQRSFYTTSFKFKKQRSRSSSPIYPEDDILVTQVTSSDNARYKRPRARLHCNVHHEPDPTSTSPAFSLTRTKFSTYNTSASAFIDLVDDPLPATAATNFRSIPRLRLRIGARTTASPLDLDPNTDSAYCHGKLRPRTLHAKTGFAKPRSEERFKDLPVRLWPGPEDDQAVWEVLNPPEAATAGGSAEIEAVADERSLVYMTGSRSASERAIVCVNFDSGIVLNAAGGYGNGEKVMGRCGSGAGSLASCPFSSKARTPARLWTEPPMYARRGRVINLQPSKAW